jgi:putative transposase
MPRPQGCSFRRALTSLISPQRIRQLAQEVGAVKRRRKIDVVALVFSLALGFSGGNRRNLAGLRRAYERATRVMLVPSSFYKRLTEALARLMACLVKEVLDRVAKRFRRLARFHRLRHVLVADGMLIRLHEGLAQHFRPVWTNYMKAAAKLHMVMTVLGRGAHSFQLTHGSRQDVRVLRVGEWLRGRLLIFDLAYYKFALFQQITEHGGYFLSRLKKRSRLCILRGEYAGKTITEVASRLTDTLVDFDVDIPAEGKYWRSRVLPGRVVGQWNDDAKRYHFYLTNMPRQRLESRDVAALYAARWEIELLFRELKVHHRLEQLPTRKRHVAECLIYAALLGVLLSRELRYRLVGADRRQRCPFDRWAVLFAQLALDVLDLLCGPPAARPAIEERLALLLFHEAPDPNRNRPPLAIRAQLGVLRNAA